MAESDQHSDLSYRVMSAIVGGTHLGIIFAAVSIEPSWPSTISLWLSSASLPLVFLIHAIQGQEPRSHARWPFFMIASVALAFSLSTLILSASFFAFVLFWLAGVLPASYVFDLPAEVRRELRRKQDDD